MSATDVHRRLLDEVQEGDALPTLAYDVTATTVVLGALASRDWRPMPHDYDFAVNRKAEAEIIQLAAKLNRMEDRLDDLSDAVGKTGH